MTNFAGAMAQTLNNGKFNSAYTDNGARVYRTTGSELLDLNFKVTQMRSMDEKTIIDLFMKAFYENKELAVKWLFYVSDVREGLGERRLFRIVSKHLSRLHYIPNLIHFIPEYSRWDNMWELLDTDTELVKGIIINQINQDIANHNGGQPISLLAKWLPSENASSTDSKLKARKIRKLLGMDARTYRKTLSTLRKYLKVVEVSMSAREWKAIEYSAVPSRANLIYNGAFLKNDESRRRKFLESLEKGETTINASVLFPHDIVHKYTEKSRYDKDIALEEMWKALPNTVQENGNTIVVADGSYSMTSTIAKTKISALSVAQAFAIYFAERSSGQFKNKYITFSERPKLVDFSSCVSLKEKIDLAKKHDEVANTNVEAVFDLILKTACNNKMTQEEIPANVLIISDMQFDQATHGKTDQRLFTTIRKRFEDKGYVLPRLIFLNVCDTSRDTIPLKENEAGVVLCSGYSVNLMKMIMSQKLDAYEVLLETLMSERYAKITLV